MDGRIGIRGQIQIRTRIRTNNKNNYGSGFRRPKNLEGSGTLVSAIRGTCKRTKLISFMKLTRMSSFLSTYETEENVFVPVYLSLELL
jgi:hypothetical protein